MRNKQGYQPTGQGVDETRPPTSAFTAIDAEGWMSQYVVKVREIVAMDNYCFERHRIMGIETRKMKDGLFVILDNGEPIVIIRMRSELAEALAVQVQALLEGEGNA